MSKEPKSLGLYEIREKRETLRTELFRLISQFEEETRVPVDSVELHRCATHFFDDGESMSCLTHLKVRLNLD